MGQSPSDARWLERGGDEEPERACTHDGHDVAVDDRRAEHRMDRARHRLGGDSVDVAEALGHWIELAGMRDQAGIGPTTSGVCAEPGLQARPDVPEGDAAAIADLARLAGGTRRLDAAGGAAEHWLQHDAAACGQWCAVGAYRVVGTVPTTSWPGTKGNETMSSK